MALGALTIVSSAAAVGPLKLYRCSLVGDSSYPTGGSTGLLAKLKAATDENGLAIVSVQPEGVSNGDRHLEYDHANEKLLVRVMSTGLERAAATDESGVTYGLLIVAK